MPIPPPARRCTAGGGAAARESLLALCQGIAGAYVRLHTWGFVHGDVHPRNVLVGADGAVRLIDFGLSVQMSGTEAGIAGTHRGGVGFFFEPEYAAACAGEGRGVAIPAASPAGEQYAVGALLYYLATGAHYRDFSLEREAMFRQIAAEPPLPLRGARVVAPWPELEAVLAQALAKDPAARFPSLADLAGALAKVPATSPGGEAGRRAAPSPGSPSPSGALLAEVLAEVAVDGPLTAAARPAASLFFGAAGVAYGLYRMALQRDDAALLSTADLWLVRAERAAGTEDAFLDPALELTAETVGEVSPYHAPSGLAAVAPSSPTPRATRRERGTPWPLSSTSASRPSPATSPPEGERTAPVATLPAGASDRDLTLGRSSLILAAATSPSCSPPTRPSARASPSSRAASSPSSWRELDSLPRSRRKWCRPISESPTVGRDTPTRLCAGGHAFGKTPPAS